MSNLSTDSRAWRYRLWPIKVRRGLCWESGRRERTRKVKVAIRVLKMTMRVKYLVKARVMTVERKERMTSMKRKERRI